MQNKKLVDLMDKFRAQLGAQVNAFTAQAVKVDEWDRSLIKQRDRALQLHESTLRLKQDADAVNAELEIILQHQDEMHNALAELEKKVEAEARNTAERPSERQQAYALVESLDKELSETKDMLTATVERLSSQRRAESAEKGSAHTALSKIMHVLDVHLNAFQWLEAQSDSLEDCLRRADMISTDQLSLQRMRQLEEQRRF